MEAKDFEKLIKKISESKEKKQRATGALQQIMITLKKDFEVGTIEQAQEKLDTLKEELESDEKKLEDMMEKLEKIVDWKNL